MLSRQAAALVAVRPCPMVCLASPKQAPQTHVCAPCVPSAWVRTLLQPPSTNKAVAAACLPACAVPVLQDGLAAATSDEVHITRDREYGLQPRRRGCMNYLHHQGPHKPLLAPADEQDTKRPGKTGGAPARAAALDSHSACPAHQHALGGLLHVQQT